MNQLIVPQEQVQPLQAPTPPQITPLLAFSTTMSVIMAVWASVWVLSQVVKLFKGEEVEKPLILK